MSLGVPAPVAEQLNACLAAMSNSLRDLAFDRVLILGPSAPRPVISAGMGYPEDPDQSRTHQQAASSLVTSDSMTAVELTPDELTPAVKSADPLAGLSPRFSIATSMLARLIRGFGFDGPISAIEVGVQPPRGFAGIGSLGESQLGEAELSLRAAAQEIGAAPTGTLLLVVGDGAAAYGDHAPLAPDVRSAGYDEAVRHALNTGDAAELQTALALGRPPVETAEAGPNQRSDHESALGLALGSLGYWPLLALSQAGVGGAGEVYYANAPLGVGYQVLSWKVSAQQ